LLVVLAILATASPAAAAKKPKGDEKPKDGGKPAAAAPAAGAASSEKPFTEWSKLTKDAEKSAGFFTLWKKRDNLYIEIPKNQLDQPFLYVVSMARGIGSNFVLGGLPIDDRMLQFERHGDRVLLVQVNTAFESPRGTPIDKARDLSIPNSIVQSFKIESENDDSKSVMVDLGSLLLSD